MPNHHHSWINIKLRMLKRKLQDFTVCCSYHVDFLHQKEHSVKEFRKQYEVLEEIGRGGFGIVYKAVRIVDRLPVAVKFVEHKHVREWTLTCKQLIPSEVCHLETCQDVDGVIEIVDWFANSKGFLIVMERPENCMDVFDLVSMHGRLDEHTARGIFRQVVQTVCDMYTKHGLIHRDIKDENLIIDMKTGKVKLVDFGATACADKAMKKEFQGTRSYCPPEWFRQLQYLPLEATSWSLGVLLFILVTGHLPFRNEIQICLGSVKFPNYLSKEVCQLIKSCLTTATSSRAHITDILTHSWLTAPQMILPMPSEAEETFEEAIMLKKKERLVDVKEAEEEREINDVVLVRDSTRREERADTQSTCTMHTAREEKPDSSMIRCDSRYDNLSTNSFADYLSMVSLDEPDVASELYHSASDVSYGQPSTSRPIGTVKSASAYNLVKMRKKSNIFKSFELDPVHENDHICDVAPTAQLSESSSEENTMLEDVETARSRIEESPLSDVVTADEASPIIRRRDVQSTSRVQQQVARLSRHRPLQMGEAASTLAIFQVTSTPVK